LRNFLQARFTLTRGTPKAREISLCEALPLAMSWLVKKRNEAMSVTGWLKTGRCPLKYQTTASLSSKASSLVIGVLLAGKIGSWICGIPHYHPTRGSPSTRFIALPRKRCTPPEGQDV
jgi:hypothetical protein